MLDGIFEIIYTFTPRGETYTQIFFTDGDDIFKINVNTRVFNRLHNEDNNDELQAYLRKRYDYHNNLVSKIDTVELNGMLEVFRSKGEDDKARKVEMIFRNRKIDNIIG
jgi:hypothetical protein